MSADVLRKAAALMRERANAATPGPWESGPGDGHQVFGNRHRPKGAESEVVQFVGKCWGWGPTEANAAHIASWHPAVALAVADWLEWVAEGVAAIDGLADIGERMNLPHKPDRARSEMFAACEQRALAVARTYLGEAQ